VQHSKERQLGTLIIDNASSWGLFDGASQGNRKECGVGFIAHNYDDHYYAGRDFVG